ncbi:MAG: hypothetical protein LBS07_03405 [Prevotellaceae bacterium]|jgi:hypothetical protein|nr:hypothetical protein [Prevotellaceae bacterium]
MIILTFPKSRSKNYLHAVKLASKFDGYAGERNNNAVSFAPKDINEKWEYFSMLFWTTVDWSGTFIEYDGDRFYSHSDKTRIFYALQEAHSNWMWNTSSRIIQHFSPNIESKKAESLDIDSMTNKQIDELIDRKLIENKKI